MRDELVDAWLNAVQHWLWIQTGESDDGDEHEQQNSFTRLQLGK